VNKSETIGKLAKAIALAQLEVENAIKDTKNEFFKSSYADLAAVLNVIRPVFSKHNIAIVQLPSFAAPIASVETMLIHESGEFISNVCSSPVGKQDAQGIGSAITYLRRYSLAAFCGIAQEDDDGNGSTKQVKEERREALTIANFETAKTFTKEQIKQTLNKYRMTPAQRTELTKLTV